MSVKKMKRVYLIGQGGHSKVIKDIIEAQNVYKIAGYLDDKFSSLKEEHGSIFAPLSYVKELQSHDAFFIVSIGDNRVRKKIVERIALPVEKYAVAIHPSAVISPSAQIGHGTAIMAKAVLNASTIIEDHVIVNTASVIEHDSFIEKFSHVSPGAILTGNVTCREGVHIGAGSSVIPNIVIGQWSVVGAGASVIRDVEQEDTVVGVPAKSIKGRVGK